jgi:hypothetical protein
VHEPRFIPGETYDTIFFSGAAFFLPFHFGTVKCLLDNNISFETAYGVSSGAQAALAMLGGSDIDLGLRQCDDLGDQLKFFTYTYMADLYGKYFEKYRSSNRAPIKELRGRLHVGVFDLKSRRSFFTSNFDTEEDLRDIISASGNIVPFMGITPQTYKDMWLIDGLTVNNLDARHLPCSLAVTPFDFSCHMPESDYYVCGSAMLSPLACFYTDRVQMDNLFIEGYQKADRLIVKNVPRAINRSREDLAKLIDKIKRQQANWKKKTGFEEANASCNFWDEFIVRDHGVAFISIAFVVLCIKWSTPMHGFLFSEQTLSSIVPNFNLATLELFNILIGIAFFWAIVRKAHRSLQRAPAYWPNYKLL